MALTAVPPFPYGRPIPILATTAQLLDATGERYACMFHAPVAGDIRKIYFPLGTVTTGDTLRGSIQDVDLATGYPDGTADQSGTVVVADADDNTWKSVTLGADRTVTRGQLLSFVVDFNSYVAGNLNILAGTTALSLFDYTALYTSSTWATGVRTPILVVEYSDGSIYPTGGIIPGVPSQTTHGSGSNPDEFGNRFTIPYACKTGRLRTHGRYTADVTFKLYDTDGSTVLASASNDADTHGTTTEADGGLPWNTEVTLVAGGTYRITAVPTSASTVRLSYLTVSAAGHLAQLDSGTTMYGTKRTDAGAWTDESTVLYALCPVITALELGSARPRMVVE